MTTTLEGASTTDAARPAMSMQQGLQQHLARLQYGGRVSSPASLLCKGYR